MIGHLTMTSKDLRNESAIRPLTITYLALLMQKTIAQRNCGPILKAGGLTKLTLARLTTEEKPTLTHYPKRMHSLITFYQFMLKMIHLTFPLLKVNRFLISNKSTYT